MFFRVGPCFIRASVILFIVLWIAPVIRGEEWEQLKNCRYIPQKFNDGDSFHVKWKKKEYIFRLYFVDCPEHYQVGGHHQRTTQQAKYFDIYKKDLYTIAEEATAFTQEALDKKFAVWTCWQDAKGQSRLPRHFAIVFTSEDENLAEALVARGYARIYGAKADPPFESERALLRSLEKAEKRARKAKAGAWAYSKSESK
ncbi:MAG: thermonuclease family protein [Verrucomicrobiota bacterium]